MNNYPTTKTNVRLETVLLEKCRSASDGNMNRFIRTALSDWLRQYALDSQKIPDWQIRYCLHKGSTAIQSFLFECFSSPKKLQTVRLHEIDLRQVKLLGFDLTRTVRCALYQKLY